MPKPLIAESAQAALKSSRPEKETPSCLGYYYFMTWTDGQSHYLTPNLMKTKDKVLGHWRTYIKWPKAKLEQ
ncbi:hypothetical protein CERSUDRAFT_99992 [Gelatoporia subvermispora B]|uniref:Uncharacterized protein n=1 Tax=Ceriporiopsis subvermispora (strain B) TaxID=914234 RepID=M2QI45_CERS8|nr:hypothetical protein CERSUDRAFT_99992 [Gelatoporia subvermispora B]